MPSEYGCVSESDLAVVGMAVSYLVTQFLHLHLLVHSECILDNPNLDIHGVLMKHCFVESLTYWIARPVVAHHV